MTAIFQKVEPYWMDKWVFIRYDGVGIVYYFDPVAFVQVLSSIIVPLANLLKVGER